MVDPKLWEPCPPANAILKFLKGKDCGILDVSTCEVEGDPCLKFKFEGDGASLESILSENSYVFKTRGEDSQELITAAHKRRKVTVAMGSTFTVPKGYKPLGTVLEAGVTYRILRKSPETETPVVCEVDSKVANEYPLGYKEFKWLYETILKLS